MPNAVKWSMSLTICFAVSAALYLWAVRGQVVLLDLAVSVAAFACF